MGFGSSRSDSKFVTSGDILRSFVALVDVLGGGSELSSVNHSSGIDCHSSSGSASPLLSRPLTLVARDDREGGDPGSLSGPPRRVVRVDLVVRVFSR